MRLVHVGASLAACGAVHAAVNARLLRRPAARPNRPLTDVSVLVPARDEERNIAECLRTLLAQEPGDGLEIIVDKGDLARHRGGRPARSSVTWHSPAARVAGQAARVPPTRSQRAGDQPRPGLRRR